MILAWASPFKAILSFAAILLLVIAKILGDY